MQQRSLVFKGRVGLPPLSAVSSAPDISQIAVSDWIALNTCVICIGHCLLFFRYVMCVFMYISAYVCAVCVNMYMQVFIISILSGPSTVV